MHEIRKYFTLTEIHQQCLNSMPEPLIGPGRPAELLPLRPAAAVLPACRSGRRPLPMQPDQPSPTIQPEPEQPRSVCGALVQQPARLACDTAEPWAAQFDVHAVYQPALQPRPRDDVDFYLHAYAGLNGGRAPQTLREDFCGTMLVRGRVLPLPSLPPPATQGPSATLVPHCRCKHAACAGVARVGQECW